MAKTLKRFLDLPKLLMRFFDNETNGQGRKGGCNVLFAPPKFESYTLYSLLKTKVSKKNILLILLKYSF